MYERARVRKTGRTKDTKRETGSVGVCVCVLERETDKQTDRKCGREG